MEEHFVRQLTILHAHQTKPKELESLDWIDGVHGALERKVNIVHVQQQQGLLDDPQPFPSRDSPLSCGELEKLGETHRRRPPMFCRFFGGGQFLSCSDVFRVDHVGSVFNTGSKR